MNQEWIGGNYVMCPLASAAIREVQKIVDMIIQQRPLHDVEKAWESMINNMSEKGNPIDVNTLVQYVIQQAYNENTGELYMYAEASQLKANLNRKAEAIISRRKR